VVANCPVSTKVDADLVPSAEQSMAQAPSPAPYLHPSGVAAGHERLTGRAPRRAPANGYEQSPAINDASLRSVLTWPFGVGAGATLPHGSVAAPWPGYRCTTGQVRVRVTPLMAWIRDTTSWPRASMLRASARTITSYGPVSG